MRDRTIPILVTVPGEGEIPASLRPKHVERHEGRFVQISVKALRNWPFKVSDAEEIFTYLLSCLHPSAGYVTITPAALSEATGIRLDHVRTALHKLDGGGEVGADGQPVGLVREGKDQNGNRVFVIHPDFCCGSPKRAKSLWIFGEAKDVKIVFSRTAEEPPRRRGRPRGAKNKATVVPLRQHFVDEASPF